MVCISRSNVAFFNEYLPQQEERGRSPKVGGHILPDFGPVFERPLKMKNVVLFSSLLAASAQADFAGVTFTSEDDVIAGATTYRFFMNFDNPVDALIAVSGNDDVSAFRITSESGLINNELVASRMGDVENISAITGAGDSFFANWGGDASFSPNFVVPGSSAQILSTGATLLEQLDNGGVFDSNPDTALTGSVFFMQLSVAQGSQLTLEGTVDYKSSSGFLQSEAMSVSVPAPGALALLGLAGLGRRRRG